MSWTFRNKEDYEGDIEGNKCSTDDSQFGIANF